ncbi:MAG TPA: secretin N-terminal domain-containing protein [Rhizomicrobium sp.]|jgi:general secretion pathway protein D|nr:secretin N-terminal domain-containing protein [Rhizomicrobium sp.]
MTLRLGMCVALAMAACLCAFAAAAQTPPPFTGAIQIVAVTPAEVSATETRVVLSFNQLAPPFTIMGNDAETAAIAFSGARLAQGLLFPGGKHGLIQSMIFSQSNDVLTLTIAAKDVIHVAAAPLAGRAISLVITSVGEPAPVLDAPAAPIAMRAESGEGDFFEVVPLKYADVSEVVGLLTGGHPIKPNDNFTPEEPAFGSAGMQGSFAGGGSSLSGSSFNQGLAGLAAEPVGQTVDETIGVDRRLNAVILRGPAARVEKLKQEILKLDVPVNSVVFETVFVELTETGARNLGLNFNNGNSQIANVAYSYAHGGLPGVNNTAPDGGIGFNLQLAIAAQIAKGNGRIISKPRIAAQSGSTAKIITGDALPILTSIALSGVNAVQQQVQYVNVGVTLQIAPRVGEDGFVTSHVFAEVSSVTGVSQGYPTISQREASTSATVRDGDSFVIGGLTQESELSNHNKLPGLGDIPLLGDLFNAETSSKTKTDLYIVVTPHVVHGGDGGAEMLKRAGAGP